jgi:LCP family protein required for cell wall assembly
VSVAAADTVESVRRRAPDRSFLRRYALAFGVAFALVAGGIVGVNLLIDQKLASVSRVHLQLASAPSSGANYLLVGSDTRAFVRSPSDRQAFGSQAGNQGQRSDTIMVLHAEPSSGHSLLVSVPRDLWVHIPGLGMAKINAAFTAGPQKLVDTLQAAFGVPIHHYAEVNFDTFRKLVDAIGTVPVYFPTAARDSFSDLNVPTPGCQHLNGAQALSFVRSRDLQVLDPATHTWRTLDALPDIGRVGRQQAFVRQLASVALHTALSNPLKANGIVDKVVGDLRLDDGFSRGDLFALIDAFRTVNPGDPSHVQTTTLPFRTGPRQQGQDVLYLQEPNAAQVLAALRDFSGTSGGAASPAPSSGSTPAGVHVRVLNASGVSGAAARTLAALQRDGFAGAGAGNDPRRLVAATEIRYPSGRDAAARVLAGYVPSAHLVTDDTVTGADAVLVVGRSFSGLSRPAPATAPAPSPARGAAPSTPQTGSLAPVPGSC